MDYGYEFRHLMAGIYTEDELIKIRDACISVSGVGGSAGSYLIDILVRKGFEHFILSEPDCYDIRNLSRQLFATTATLGKQKLGAAVNHILNINPQCTYKTYHKVDIETIEDIIKGSTVVSYQAEGFSPWILTNYMCSKYHVPFVNVARKKKSKSRTAIATTVFDYKSKKDVFNIQAIDFESFGIKKPISESIIKMFDSGKFEEELLACADNVHERYKKKERFKDIGLFYPEVGSIMEKYPDDYFKRYSDPEIAPLAAALASRAITDIVVGRKTHISELDIFSRPEI